MNFVNPSFGQSFWLERQNIDLFHIISTIEVENFACLLSAPGEALVGDIESEQFHNNFEIEVSDLDEPESAANASRPSQLFRKPRSWPRQRRTYLMLLNGLLMLVVVLLLCTTTTVSEKVSSVFIRPAPSPTATLFPGVDLFYVRANPPWGRLLIDGYPTALPAIGIDPPLRLARGQRQLVWQADPFQAQQCTVSIPPTVADTCSDHETTQEDSSGLSPWLINFSASLATLAGTPRAELLQAVQVALSFRLDANEASNEACIDIQPGNCTWNYQDCRLFCGDAFLASSSTRTWDVIAPVLSLWTFATMDGRVLARDVPDDSAQDYATDQTLDESLVQLHITWDDLGWHVTVPVDMEIQGSQSATGCLAVGRPQSADGLTTPTPSPHTIPPVLYYLQRFGVLLAVNKLSQSTGLLLPVADAYEQQLVTKLIDGLAGKL
jgi:hypothetical protein